MAWTWYSGKACFLSGIEGDQLFQSISQIAGNQYVVKFDIVGLTQGKIKVNNYEGINEFTESGSYAILGEAINSILVFTAEVDDNDLLPVGACIDNVAVFQFSTFSPLSCSPCINVLESQDECLLEFKVSESGVQLGFDWTDLELKAKIKAKFAKGDYDTKKDAFDDNGGDYIVNYFDGKKNRSLLIEAAPGYIHDFLFMCMGTNSLTINGVEYVMVDDNYPSITWNREFKEGTVELRVRKKNYKLNKTNCG